MVRQTVRQQKSPLGKSDFPLMSHILLNWMKSQQCTGGEGLAVVVRFMDLEGVLAAGAATNSASLMMCCQQEQIQDPQHALPATL